MASTMSEFKERRRTARAQLDQVVLIEPLDPQLPEEYCKTANISALGIYVLTSARHYSAGQNVSVTAEFQPGSLMKRVAVGSVVRVDPLTVDQFGVAIRIE
jgi:hypothetical protein